VLWITNDLPPRAGGIEQFVGNLLDRVHPEDTLVLGPAADAEAAALDRQRGWHVVRAPGRVLPTPRIRRLAARLGRDHGAEVVVLGASWPLGELATALRADLGVPVVALSHGLEAGLTTVGLGHLIRRATRGLAALTTISDWTEQRLAPHVAAERIRRVPPGVDVARFTPQVDGARMRAAWGVPAQAPLVGCISRLVQAQGPGRAARGLARGPPTPPRCPAGAGGGGAAGRRAGGPGPRLGPDAGVVLPGRLAWEELPSAHAALDVFAMPCRTRLGGTDVEGLGIVYLEAQACGVPAVAGRSGGAPEAVRDGETGTVVDGEDPAAVAAALDRWLADPAGRREAGERGRRWVEQRWSWEAIAAAFEDLLAEVVGA
jgi:phosphatidyl-myo-inositol dimannoside synthase